MATPNERKILIQTATSKAWLQTNYLSQEELMILQKVCRNDIQARLEHHPPLMVFGKPGIMHRSIGFFSNTSEGYRYSNQIARSQPLTDELEALVSKVNEDLQTNFNGILVNYYENGKETIGAHSDDEKGLGRGSLVAGISLGAARIMRFRPKKLQKQLEEASSSLSIPPNNTRIDVELPDNSLIVMEGDFQKEYTHEVPSQAKILEPRISFTFRHHIV